MLGSDPLANLKDIMHPSKLFTLAMCAAAPLSAQMDWVPLPGSPPLGARQGHAMAYDEARGETVVFGGTRVQLVLADTWTFDGAVTWTQKQVPGPSPRTGHTMVYDPVRQVVVLFGGVDQGTGAVNNETWEWDGSSWSRRFSNTSPPAWAGMASAPWPALGGVVLHWGDPAGSGAAEFWLWDGVDWSSLTTPMTPVMYSHSMAYHASLQQLVLVGGGQTWVWDGSEWWRDHTGTPERDFGRLAYDSNRNEVIAVGGVRRADPLSNLGDTWVWRGAWTELDTASSVGRTHFDMVYDAGVGRIMLYGGRVDGLVNALDDVHVLSPVSGPGPFAASAVSGFGFASRCVHIGDGLFTATSIPTLGTGGQQAWIDETLSIYVGGVGSSAAPAPTWLVYGTSNRTWNGQPLPAPLNALGRPACFLLVDVVDTLGQVSTGGAAWHFDVPNLPALVGSTHYFQALGFAARGSLFTSNGLECTLGVR